jgi:hypothetical protein
VGWLPVVEVLELPRCVREVALVDVRSGAGPILACCNISRTVEVPRRRRAASPGSGAAARDRVERAGPGSGATESETGDEGR